MEDEASPSAPPARKLLILGTSGTMGAGMAAGARLWPQQVQEGLAERHGPVDLTRRRFYVHGGKPFDILEEELAREEWDFIVVQCTSYAATQKTVAHRVRNVLGKRAGQWTEAQVLAVDTRIRHKGRVRHALYRAGHRIARKTIGTAPLVSLDTLIPNYLKAIDRIAMVETAAIVVMGTGAASDSARRNNKDVERIKAKFDGTISGAAKRKHLGWVESAAITRESDDPEAMFLDMLHKGQAWHDGVAKRVLEQFAAQR